MTEASGIPAWAVRGAKVVCVDAAPSGRPHIIRVKRLTQGAIYTVRGVSISEKDGEVGLLLDEVTNAISPTWDVEYNYLIHRFRPAVPPKTQAEDVGLFRYHLDDVRANA